MSISQTQVDRISDQHLKNNEVARAALLSQKVPQKWDSFARLIRLPRSKELTSAGDEENKDSVPFEPYRYQRLITDGVRSLSRQLVRDGTWDSHQYTVIVNKFRQSGISTSVLSFFLWRAAKSKAHRACGIFPSREDASGMARRCREMINTIPEEYSLTLSSNNLSYIELLGRGGLTLKSTSARSQSLDGLLLDEAAFHQKASEVYSASAPALSNFPDSAATYLVSTPKGKNNFFYQFLAESLKDFGNPSEVGWDVANGKLYSLDYPGFFWYRSGHTIVVFLGHQAIPKFKDYSFDRFINYAQEKYRLTEAKALVEFGLTFESSDDEVFPEAVVAQCVFEGLEEKEPSQDAVYFASIDPNNGSTGNDFAVLLIFKITNGKKRIVRQWRSNSFNTNQSLFYCRQILSEFSPKAVFIESNGGGRCWADALSESNFRIIDCYTTQANKAAMVSQLLLDLEQVNLQLDKKANSAVISELLSFQRLGSTANGGVRYGAVDGGHDDGVMSLAIGNFYIEHELRENPYSYLTPEGHDLYPKHLEAQLYSGDEEDY